MADLAEIIRTIRDDPAAITRFTAAVEQLIANMITHHGNFRGTHEAVLAEAQGARLHGAGAAKTHLESLRQSMRMLANREREIEAEITRFARISNTLAAKLRELVRPLLQISRNLQNVAGETERIAADLARTHGTRLRDVFLQTGGVTDAGRTQAALISSQLQAQAVQLRARGIEPSIIPNLRLAAGYIGRLQQLALNQKEAIALVLPLVSAVSAAISSSLARAGATGRALLSTVLRPLLVVLGNIRGGFGMIIIIPPGYMESLGVKEPQMT